MSKIRVIECQGFPHTLTQADGKTFRLFAREVKEIDEKLISPEFLAEQKEGYIILDPVENEVAKNTKGGTK